MDPIRNQWTGVWGVGCNWYGTAKVRTGHSAVDVFLGWFNERIVPVEWNTEGYCAKAGVVQPSGIAVCWCILRSMASYTSDTANERVVTSGHTFWWALKPQCESCLPRLCSAFSSHVSSLLLSLSFPSLSAFIWSALHQQEESVEGSQLCHAWKGKTKQGSLIRSTDWGPWVAKEVRVVNCGSPDDPEQLPWMPLLWRIPFL